MKVAAGVRGGSLTPGENPAGARGRGTLLFSCSARACNATRASVATPSPWGATPPATGPSCLCAPPCTRPDPTSQKTVRAFLDCVPFCSCSCLFDSERVLAYPVSCSAELNCQKLLARTSGLLLICALVNVMKPGLRQGSCVALCVLHVSLVCLTQKRLGSQHVCKRP